MIALVSRFTPRQKALLAITISSLFFSLMSAITKAATSSQYMLHPLPGGVLAFYRYAGSLIVLLGMRQVLGVPLLGNDRVGLVWRGVSGGIAATLFFVSLQQTSLTHSVLLNYTSLIWGPLFAMFALRERLSSRYLFILPIGLVGVVIVTHPEMSGVHIGDGIALISGIVSGSAIVQIRRLRRTEAASSIFFYFNLLGMPISFLVLTLSHTPLTLPTLAQLPFVAGVVFSSVLGQMLMTYSFRELSTAEGGLLSMTTNLYSPLIAIVFFQDHLHTSTLIGGALILFSSCTLILNNQKPKAKKPQ